MSTCIDFSYRFEGTAEDLDKARAAITKIVATAGEDGVEDDPTMNTEGDAVFLRWGGFTYSDPGSWNKTFFKKLTSSGSMTIWSYQGCTDGCSEGAIEVIQSGATSEQERWDGDIGMDAARAMIALQAGPDAAAALKLIERAQIGVEDGYDEDDAEHLMSAAVCCEALSRGLKTHPELLSDPQIGPRLGAFEADLTSIHDDLEAFDFVDATFLKSIGWLLAQARKIDIASCIPAAISDPKPKKRL